MPWGRRLGYFCRRHHTGLTVCLVAGILALLPLILQNPYKLGLLNLIALQVIVVLGLNLFIGFAGQISLGHAAFFGLGAYGSAILTSNGWLGPWPALVVTAAGVALLAFLLGGPILRLHGHYLAMATLGFNYVFHIILVEWDQVTGGPSGLMGVPPLHLFGLPVEGDLRFYYLVWLVALLALTMALNLLRSGVGRGLAALAQDEVAAACLGVEVKRLKIKIFILAAVLASLAGSLYAHYFGYVNPDAFSIFKSVDLVIMVVVGGLGSVWGTLVGVGLLTLLSHYLEFLESYFDLIHGAILVIILMFLPEGLITGIVDRLRLAWAKSFLARQNFPGGES